RSHPLGAAFSPTRNSSTTSSHNSFAQQHHHHHQQQQQQQQQARQTPPTLNTNKPLPPPVPVIPSTQHQLHHALATLITGLDHHAAHVAVLQAQTANLIAYLSASTL